MLEKTASFGSNHIGKRWHKNATAFSVTYSEIAISFFPRLFGPMQENEN